MNFLLSTHWLLVAAGWYGINGLLHDLFVIKAHEGSYNRELLHLLMDGHVLLLSSALLTVCWWMLRSGVTYGAIIGFIVALGMLVYCAMIFPFLKSFGTLAITIMSGIVCIIAWQQLTV